MTAAGVAFIEFPHRPFINKKKFDPCLATLFKNIENLFYGADHGPLIYLISFILILDDDILQNGVPFLE